MSQSTLWVCGTPTGPKEIIRSYGVRPFGGLCVAPHDNLSVLDIKWFYLKPGTDERVDLTDGSDLPPAYYYDYENSVYVTPVTDPPLLYWKDGEVWKSTTPPEGVVPKYEIVHPKQEVEAVINSTALSAYDAAVVAEERQKGIQMLTDAVQRMLDKKANEKGYDSALSCVSYLGTAGNFGSEASAMRDWRTNVWTWCFTQLQTYEGNLPTSQVLIASILAQYPAPW